MHYIRIGDQLAFGRDVGLLVRDYGEKAYSESYPVYQCDYGYIVRALDACQGDDGNGTDSNATSRQGSIVTGHPNSNGPPDGPPLQNCPKTALNDRNISINLGTIRRQVWREI